MSSEVNVTPRLVVWPEINWIIRNFHIVLIFCCLPIINLFIVFEQPTEFYTSTQTLLYWTIYYGSGVVLIYWLKSIQLTYHQFSPMKIANRMAVYLGILFGIVAAIWSIIFNLKIKTLSVAFSDIGTVSFYYQYPEVAFFIGFFLTLISTAIVFISYMYNYTGIRAIIMLALLPVFKALTLNLPGVYGFLAKLLSFSDLAISNTYGDLTKSDNAQLNYLLLLLRQGFWPAVNAQKIEAVVTLAFLILLATILWLPFYSFNRYHSRRSNLYFIYPDYYAVVIVIIIGIMSPVSDNVIFNTIYYSIFGIGIGWRYGCTLQTARVLDLRIVATFMAIFVGYYYHHNYLTPLFNAGVILLASTLTSLIAIRESNAKNQGIFTTSLMLIGLQYLQTLMNLMFKLKLSDIELQTPIIVGLLVWIIVRLYESKFFQTRRLQPINEI